MSTRESFAEDRAASVARSVTGPEREGLLVVALAL